MFCDLVESTPLGERLDPEDLTDIIRAYQDACAAVIDRFDGHIARYAGDGFLTYFGYPRAHEDDAERALLAALDILVALEQLDGRLDRKHGVRLAVRIGIHTGLVVVGDVGGGPSRETMALGHTMNLAARLQAIAEPGTVVISDQTLRLVRGTFVTQDLGVHPLKGIARPVRAHRVVRQAGGGDHGVGAASLAPLVGRERDLSFLLERWSDARQRSGQVVLLRGEPGIGKSRLLRELRAKLTGERHTWLECRASPYHQSSALYPVVTMLRRLLGIEPEETRDDQRAKLERAGLSAEVIALFTELLSPAATEHEPAPARDVRRRKTLEALAAWLLRQADLQPTVAVVEDLHWIDPSSLELLGMLLERVPTAPLLVVASFRPTFEPPWESRPNVAHLTLMPLTRPEAAAIVQAMTEGKTLPPTLLDQLVDKTDGVPLFVEELTKTVLESGGLAEREGRYERTDPSRELAVPSTLQDSLMARLDRLGAAKDTAQLAAVLGREFSFEVLEAVSATKPPALQHALDQLTHAEVLYQRGLPPRATYVFKHALIQETAYHSLLRSARQQYHGRVAATLEARFPDLAQTQLEVLTRHHEEAGNVREAIDYCRRAGELATRRSANLEAIRHLTHGIELAQKLPGESDRDHWEAIFRLALGVPLQAAKGYADAEVERCYRRAHELCGGGDPQLEFKALWGLFQHFNSRAELETARHIISQLVDLARRADDRSLRVLAHASSGVTHFWCGEPALAVRDAEETLSRYDASSDVSLGYLYGHDPGVAAQAFMGCALAQQGRADLGRRSVEASLERARQHPFDLAFALAFAGIFHAILRQRELTRAIAEEGMAVSSQHGFPLWLGVLRLLRSWAVSRVPGETGAVEGIRLGMAEQMKTGNQAGAPLGMALLADAQLAAGNARRALGSVEAGLALSEQTGSHVCDAELYRLRGQLFLLDDPPREADAEHAFRHSAEVARLRGMQTFQLRSTVCLAQLALGRGRRDEARAMLGPVYQSFREGFDTPDLVEAKALLEALT